MAMASAVWKFDRSLEDTIEELRDILERECATPIRAEDVHDEWVYRAQLVIEPAGWDALWKLSQQKCIQYNVRSPCVVYVTVNSIEIETSLDAQVEVIGVQDAAVSLLQYDTVPLEQLWPLKNQSNTAIDVKNTARFIDLYRYFYSYIWLPWELDCTDPENTCWFAENVPARCKLWANAYSGNGCSPVILKSLLQEGNLVKNKIGKLEEDLPSDTEDNDFDCSSTNIRELATLHNQLDHIKLKWETLMNPAVKYCESDSNTITQRNNIVIWNGGQLNHYIKFLGMIEKWLVEYQNTSNDVQISCSQSLQDSLMNKLMSGSRIILCPGTHNLPPIDAWMHNECSVISPSNNSTLKCTEERATAIMFSNKLNFVNITLDMSLATTGLAVRGGQSVLTECILKGPESKMAQACVVYPKSKVAFQNCKIDGFFTGIVAHAGSEVELKNCSFENCDVAIQIYSGAKINMDNCTFNGYSESAIRFDNKNAEEITKGNISLLQKSSDIHITNCKFSPSNKVNDVCITPYNEFAFTEIETI